ncbi:MAG: SPOR domain-containing protein [Pseudomonadota bacterium]
MRSKLLLSSAIVCCISAPASADDPYVRLNYGRTFQDATITDRTDDIEAIATLDVASGNLFGFAIGTDLDFSESDWLQFSWEGEFAYRSANVNGAQISGAVPGGFIDGADLDDVTTYSLLGNIWWRPTWFGKIRPYAGGGAGAAYLPAGGLSGDDIYSLAYQFGGGVDYQFDNGVRAGIGFRHFEISANDRDTSDPLFTFETESELSENTLYASAAVPFAVFTGDSGGRARSTAATRATDLDKAQKEAAKVRAKAEAKARKDAERQAKAEAKAKKKALKQARKDAEKVEKQTDKETSKTVLRRLNPFSKKDDSEKTAESAPRPTLREEANAFDAIETASVTSSPAFAAPAAQPTLAAARVDAPLPKPQAASGYFAQLGAYSTNSMARDMWRAKSGRQPEVFNGATHVIAKTTARKSGKSLYLLQVGPYDKGGAKAMCALAAGDCLVVKN